MRNADSLLAAVREYAGRLAEVRPARQRRRSLDPADLTALRELGLHLAAVPVASGGGGAIVYTSVIVGVVDAAMRYMRDYLLRRGEPGAMRASEQVEWAASHREAWLLQQAFEAALQAFERYGSARHETALAKANIAVLAESVLTRLCRIAGGSVYGRHSPLGRWFEDVRALGFLRPPWALASDRLFAMSWAQPPIGFA